MSTRYVHTNIVSQNWRQLAHFYQTVFDCQPIPPMRDLAGDWLDKGTGLKDCHLQGVHLRLPGSGENGPTLEIFQYDALAERLPSVANRLGIGHLAFHVDDVHSTVEQVLQQGGNLLGEVVERFIDGVGHLTFVYLTDPEGNILEIQHWA